MHYLIASDDIVGLLTPGCRVVANGETLSFEEPWSFGKPILVRVDHLGALEELKDRAGLSVASAFAVEGLEEPGTGQAYGLGAHLMRDAESFGPYAAAVGDVVRRFGGRFLTRGGTVTPVTGSFVPDRVVIIEFPTADDAVAFYFSDEYAPLLKVRLAATDPRFCLASRSGALPESARSIITAKLAPT